jgi:hypothetical protein
MHRSNVRALLVAAGAVGVAAAAASAQWSDDFESYPLGNICGQGGWEPWFNNANVCSVVSDAQAFSGSQSLKVQGAVGGPTGLGDDMVYIFNPPLTGGTHTFRTMTYIPSTAIGNGYVILLNTYNHQNIGLNWSLQVQFDALLGTVRADFTNETATLVTDQWVEFRAEIDLDNDSVDYFYDGQQFVFGKSWVNGVSTGGAPQIEAICLYGNEPGARGIEEFYFDDISMEPANGCYPDCDGSGSLDFFDFLCFQNAFLAQDPYADCDNSGVFDFFDFLCFQNAFLAGCP